MRIAAYALGLVLVAGAMLPTKLAAQAPAKEPAGPDTVVFTPTRGKVTFTHGAHSKAFECSSCHHESRPEKPLTSPKQKCGDCHTEPATAPMKTGLKAAFHDTVNKEGTCFTCHKKQAEAGKETPSACMDCHKKEQ